MALEMQTQQEILESLINFRREFQATFDHIYQSKHIVPETKGKVVIHNHYGGWWPSYSSPTYVHVNTSNSDKKEDNTTLVASGLFIASAGILGGAYSICHDEYYISGIGQIKNKFLTLFGQLNNTQGMENQSQQLFNKYSTWETRFMERTLIKNKSKKLMAASAIIGGSALAFGMPFIPLASGIVFLCGGAKLILSRDTVPAVQVEEIIYGELLDIFENTTDELKRIIKIRQEMLFASESSYVKQPQSYETNEEYELRPIYQRTSILATK